MIASTPYAPAARNFTTRSIRPVFDKLTSLQLLALTALVEAGYTMSRRDLRVALQRDAVKGICEGLTRAGIVFARKEDGQWIHSIRPSAFDHATKIVRETFGATTDVLAVS